MSTQTLLQDSRSASRQRGELHNGSTYTTSRLYLIARNYRLVTLCGGDVRGRIFSAAEHLLRMVANFQEDQLSLAIRFLFDPDASAGLQRRLSLQIALGVSEVVSEDTVRATHQFGALGRILRSQGTGGCAQDSYDLPQRFPAICEVIRQEERVKPLIRKEENPGRIPELYYSISPLEARGDNDYALVDALLSRMAQPWCR